MDNPAGTQEGPPKKGPLENLSREELIRKCKGLLGLAQKAKQAKDEFAEENKKLKEELNKFETQKDADKKSLIAMKEIVDALTENKLTLTTQVADHKAQCDRLQSELQKFDQMAIENEALKRQMKRLSDENEELLTDLDAMEKKLDQVNQFGIQQQKDLVLLEKETAKWKDLEHSVEELQKELKQKVTENENLQSKCKALEEEISGHKSLEETQNLKAILENSQTLISTLQTEKTDLTARLEGLENKTKNIESYEKTIEMQALEIDQLKKSNDKHAARLQLFKSKIVEFSLKLKKLKKSREILIETVQEYAQSVPKWQKEIMNASNQISNQLLSVDLERKALEKEVARLQHQLEKQKTKLRVDEDVSRLDRNRLQELCLYVDRAYLEYQEKVEQLGIKCGENEDLRRQLSELAECLSKSQSECEEKVKDIAGLETDIAALKSKLNKTLGNTDTNLNDELKQKLHQTELDYAVKSKELENLKNQLDDITLKHSKAIAENDDKANEVRQLKEELEAVRLEMSKLTAEYENLQQTIQISNTSSDEAVKRLESEISLKAADLRNLEQERNNLCTSLKEKSAQLEQFQSSLRIRETENSDLLAEMRELNEAFKGRGDVISRQQDKIKELENEIRQTAEKLSKIEVTFNEKDNEIKQKELQITSMNKEIVGAKEEVANLLDQAKQNEIRIKSLSDEMSTMREKYQECQSDAISTSTISKVDEVARLREVDESFEEKYNKLRALAVKLKKKVQEQAAYITTLERDSQKSGEDKSEITTKLKVKNLQALQNENDKLLDEVEKLKAANHDYEKKVKSLEAEMSDIKNCSSNEKMDKTKLDNTIKACQTQIKSLKQEKESMNLIRKEIEKERDSLKTELAKKSEELGAMKTQCDKLKSEIERKKSAEKQSSVLNLEIEAYEKSLNDATHKLEKSKITIQELKEEAESKEATIKALNAQIKFLEENIESEKMHSLELKQQIDIQHAKFKESEHEKMELRTQLQDRTQESEDFKSEVNSLQLQLSTIASDREKLCSSLQAEKEKLLRSVLSLEENVDEYKNRLRTTEHELEDLRAEYASYKIKAQSVLRQSQSKESSRERELEEELNACHKSTETLTIKLKAATDALESNEKKIEDLRQDNERVQRRCKELIQALEDSRLQNEQLLEDNRKQSHDYQDSLKSYRLQIETLNNCYKTQIEDLEKKHQIELEELRKQGMHLANMDSKLTSRVGPFGGPNKPTNDEQKIDLILMEREDAEGSETTSTAATKRKISASKSRRDFVPLDELLNSPLEDTLIEDFRSVSPTLELQQTKEKLHVQESRVKHLTALLAENEQDLAKLTQLNELLKEEVRRQERSMEREPHVQNSEYLKNIVLKFLTLNSGDERTRLVPVLNTILKLSPEETQALQNVAKGAESVGRSWGSYLPIWSNHQ